MNRPSPDDMKAMQVMEYVEKLEKNNKGLKEKLVLTENDRDEWQLKAKDLLKENKELKEHKENLIRADKKKTEYIEELEQENKELKERLSSFSL